MSKRFRDPDCPPDFWRLEREIHGDSAEPADRPVERYGRRDDAGDGDHGDRKSPEDTSEPLVSLLLDLLCGEPVTIRLGESVHLAVEQERQTDDHRKYQGRVRHAQIWYPQKSFRRKFH